jgi:hypothetical protein
MYKFEPGLYQHYKGGFYTALMLVTHHENRQPMVLYISHANGSTNVRPLFGWGGDPSSWASMVMLDETTSVPRFKFIRELPSNTPIGE